MLTDKEKIELFGDIREIKTTLKLVKEKVDHQPCREHAAKIERVKYTILFSIISLFIAFLGILAK